MSPREFTQVNVRETAVLGTNDDVTTAVRALVESGLPALPVADPSGRYAGIFGEREFMAALFPGYLSELKTAHFVPHSVDQVLDMRGTCRDEPVSRYVNSEHVEVGADFSDATVAEIFLHHRVLVIPIVENGKVRGLFTRRDFFENLAGRFLEEE